VVAVSLAIGALNRTTVWCITEGNIAIGVWLTGSHEPNSARHGRSGNPNNLLWCSTKSCNTTCNDDGSITGVAAHSALNTGSN
jgi:hypothetical protein